MKTGEEGMRICYDKLRKLMIDNKMKRCDLIRAAELSEYTATKINKDVDLCQYFGHKKLNIFSLHDINT